MKKVIASMMLVFFSSLTHAEGFNLDKVNFQMAAKQWVTTQTALLSVSINVALSNTDTVKVRDEIMNNLNKIAQADWQITQFDRSEDNSGLEKLFVAAQARVLQTGLKNIYQSAKAVSKPGATYEVNGIEFKPSVEEIQQVKAQLRDKLYQQINEEIGRLNNVFGSQKYTLNDLIFYGNEEELLAARAYQPRVMNVMAEKLSTSSAPAVSISNELILKAFVVLASTRQGENSIATH